MKRSNDPKSSHQLEALRRQIRAKDQEILTAIADRMQLAKKIGAIKLKQGMPIKDYRTEKVVLKHAADAARELGIYRNLAEDVTKLLMRYSILAQDENHSRAKASAAINLQKILIVGGAGRMGQWLTGFFESFGHEVIIHDPVLQQNTRPLSNASNNKSYQPADVAVIATPLSASADAITKVISSGVLRSGGLLFDICSLKAPVEKALKKASQSGYLVASAHPMFGPSVDMLSGHNILVCTLSNKANDKKAGSACAKLFAGSTARLVAMPIGEHDALMARVLGLSHLTNLVYSGTLARSGFRYSTLESSSSTTFAAQAAVARNVSSENIDLYFEIQQLNPHTPEIIRWMTTTLKDFENTILKNQLAKFRNLMATGRDFWTEKPRVRR